MLHRGYHKKARILIYDLFEKEEGKLYGRVDGTDKWVCCDINDIVPQRHTKHYDINNRPIFEEDTLRDKYQNTYRVVFEPTQEIGWALYHIEGRNYFPLVDMQRFEVIGHKLLPITLSKAKQQEPFPDPAGIFKNLQDIEDITPFEYSTTFLKKQKQEINAIEIPSLVQTK